MRKIIVLFNTYETNSPESEKDTVVSANWVYEVLKRLNYETELVGVNKDNMELIGGLKCDLVFNLVEWTGPDTKYAIDAINFMKGAGIPFTGSDVFGYGVVCEKGKMKKLMLKAGISTPKFHIIKTGKEKYEPLPYPIIVKPANEHCAVGVSQSSVAENEADFKKLVSSKLAELDQPLLAEQYIDGREFHVTVLEEKGKPLVLPPAEVIFEKRDGFRPILTYAAKWKEASDEFGYSSMEAAKLDTNLKNQIEDISKKTYEVMGGRDYPRLDMRYDGKELYVLEINNNPGIDYETDSGIGVSARAAGMSAEKLVEHIIINAQWRWKHANEIR